MVAKCLDVKYCHRVINRIFVFRRARKDVQKVTMCNQAAYLPTPSKLHTGIERFKLKFSYFELLLVIVLLLSADISGQ